MSSELSAQYRATLARNNSAGLAEAEGSHASDPNASMAEKIMERAVTGLDVLAFIQENPVLHSALQLKLDPKSGQWKVSFLDPNAPETLQAGFYLTTDLRPFQAKALAQTIDRMMPAESVPRQEGGQETPKPLSPEELRDLETIRGPKRGLEEGTEEIVITAPVPKNTSPSRLVAHAKREERSVLAPVEEVRALRRRAIEIMREKYELSTNIEIDPSSQNIVPGTEDETFANAFRAALKTAKEESVVKTAPAQATQETREERARLQKKLRDKSLKLVNETYGTHYLPEDLLPGTPFVLPGEKAQEGGLTLLEIYAEAFKEVVNQERLQAKKSSQNSWVEASTASRNSLVER